MPESPVTIGIGVLCDGGETIILASDTRISYRGTALPSDSGGKQFDFPPFVLAGAIAGNVSITGTVVSEMAVQLSGLLSAKRKSPNELIVSQHIRLIIDRARKRELRTLQECAMLADLGIHLRDWQCGKLPDAQRLDDLALRYGVSVLQRVKQEFRSKLGLIVVGFVENGIVFMRAVGAERVEETSSPEVYVIGSGSKAAMDVLSARGQHIDCTLARSLLHVYEALKAARRKEPGTVGPPAAYVVLRSRDHGELPGISRFPAESHLLKGWYKAYKKRTSTHSLDTLMANNQAKCLFRQYDPRPKMVLTHETFDCTPLDSPDSMQSSAGTLEGQQ